MFHIFTDSKDSLNRINNGLFWGSSASFAWWAELNEADVFYLMRPLTAAEKNLHYVSLAVKWRENNRKTNKKSKFVLV